MKTYKWLIALIFVCSTQVVCAQVYDDVYSYDPCPCFEQDNCCSKYNFSVYGDYLWWKVCRSELQFSNDDVIHYISPNYDAGYRVGGKVGCRCIDLGARYTNYGTKGSKRSAGGIEEDEQAKFTFDYEVFDIELGFNFSVDCACGVIRPFAGVKFADIDEKFDQIETNDEYHKLDFTGTGLYVGAEGTFNVYTWYSCDCCSSVPVNLVARASTGVLDGTFKYRTSETLKRKDECFYVPVGELSLIAELEFRGFASFINPKLRLGYEVNTYRLWRELNSSADVATLGLGGMVLGLEADF